MSSVVVRPFEFTHREPALREVVLCMRTTTTETHSAVVQGLLAAIASDGKALQQLQQEITALIDKDGLDQLLLDSDIPKKSNFWGELTSKLRHRLLPSLKSDNAFRYQLLQVLNFDADFAWLTRISADEIKAFHELVFEPNNHSVRTNNTAIKEALTVLSVRLTALASEEELSIRQRAEKSYSLFLALQQSISDTLLALEENNASKAQRIEHCLLLSKKCEHYFSEVKKAAEWQGTSVHTSFLLSKGIAMLNRMTALLGILKDNNHKHVHQLIQAIARAEQSKQHFSSFFKANIQALSLQISEHKSHSGEHYIANGKKEYFSFFYAAVGAGLIVSVLVFCKAWIQHWNLPVLWEAVAFSINYIIGFLLIQFFHFTLATKQPAMTAASLAREITDKKSGKSLRELAITIARVCHTQTVSFIGNLLIVFPLPFFFAFLLDTGFGYQLFTEDQALNVIRNQHPWKSGALLFAGITGVYLFASGILAGYTDNRVIFSRIPERIRQHQGLKQFLGEKKTFLLATYMSKNAGSLAGNISLGFFLGTASFVGNISGLPYDIRHITFAAGSFSSAMYYAHWALPLHEIITVVIGILLIGFVNFSVSFGLAFFIAIRSRGIVLLKNQEFLTVFLRYLRKFPLDFIVSPWRPRKPEDLS